jgi:hypothetical protein
MLRYLVSTTLNLGTNMHPLNILSFYSTRNINPRGPVRPLTQEEVISGLTIQLSIESLRDVLLTPQLCSRKRLIGE